MGKQNALDLLKIYQIKKKFGLLNISADHQDNKLMDLKDSARDRFLVSKPEPKTYDHLSLKISENDWN